MKILNKNTVRLLKLFYEHPEGQFYIQEIGRLLGKKPGVFQRALNNLHKDGLLLSEYKANARFFRINKNYYIYNELKSIIEKSVKICLIITAFLFCTNFLYAGQKNFTLNDAIQIAYKSNKDIQMQEQEITVASANIVEAASVFYPQLNLKAVYTHNKAVLDENIFSGYINDNLIQLNATQSVYSGGANMATFKQAKLSLDAQKETLRAKKMDIEFEAKRLYYGLLLAYETERIAKDALNQAIAHYENVKQMYKHGTVSRFDMLQSGVQVSLLEPDVVKAKNEIDSLKADLNKLLGLKIDSPIQPEEKLTYTFIGIKENEFLKIAYLDRPEMKLKSLGIDIDNWEIQMARSGYRPTVDLLVGYSARSNNLGNILEKRQRNWNAGVSVNIPIFEGFSTRAKVDAAKAKYTQAKIDKDNLVDQIAVDVRKACLNLRESASIIQSQKDNLAEAKEALRISEVSYANGVAINLDVLDSQVSLAQIQRNLASGIYDYLMAQAYLDRSIGKSIIREASLDKGNTPR
ncbi:MAG: TolC family protein [Candidatus Omnitrophica bacterium]|nr:TolC family protein [Candidatus Omnitrophota bacterium]